MIVTNTAFLQFTKTVGLQQPYCDVLLTRSNYHCKWLLLTAKSTKGILRRRRGYYVIQSSCLSKSTQRHLIVSGEALPLSPVYDEVINCIETWGNTLKPGWAQDVYHYIFNNRNDTEKKSIYAECLYKLIRKMARAYVGPTRLELINGWIDYFDANYDYHQEDFHRFTIASIRFIEDTITLRDWVWNNPELTPSMQTPQLEESANIVPPSPVKNETPVGELTLQR